MEFMPRSVREPVLEFLKEKIVLLSGPRQVGKTKLSKNLCVDFDYLNYDSIENRRLLTRKEWRRDVDLVILDELHKMRGWKSWLKGLYDTEGTEPNLLVTGSARLDIYRKGGDSLAGRHHLVRMLPLSVAETGAQSASEAKDALAQIIEFGGFPEPFLKSNARSAKLWRKSHLDVILREDLLDLEKVRDVKSIEILVDLLADRVGSTISYSSLAQDLQVSSHTVKHWIEILENLFVVFTVKPYSKNLAKAIRKESKIYFYDVGRVSAGDGAKLENLVACHLLKRNFFLSDTQGENAELYYVRDREQREVDFLTVINRKPEWLIEVKQSDESFAKSLAYFRDRIEPKNAYQLVLNPKRERDADSRLSLRSAATFLSQLEA